MSQIKGSSIVVGLVILALVGLYVYTLHLSHACLVRQICVTETLMGIDTTALLAVDTSQIGERGIVIQQLLSASADSSTIVKRSFKSIDSDGNASRFIDNIHTQMLRIRAFSDSDIDTDRRVAFLVGEALDNLE